MSAMTRSIPEGALQCANPTCGKRDSWGFSDSVSQPGYMVVAGTGRPPKYCSDACKQDAYRARKAEQQREADRVAAIAAAARRDDHIERVVYLALIQSLPTNSRPTTTRIKSAAEHITRSLNLAGLT